MMPPIIDSGAPPGEHRVFERLASDPLAEDWTVLHSLGLAKHVRQSQGEADFVIIVPGQGVAVIEVKSHQRVAFSNGRWKLGNDAPTSRGPFQQSNEAMHSIRGYLLDHNVDLRQTPIVSGVWFTHVRARAVLPESPEWHDWQLLDLDDFRTGAAKAVCRLVQRGREHLSDRLPNLRREPYQPDELKSRSIIATLRPRFEVTVGPSDVRRQREARLSAFLDEQYDALDAMAENRSVLFTGPAGSGKTLLAVESARREAAKGREGRLLCFNRLLGMNLAKSVTGTVNLRADSFNRELLQITGIRPPEQNDSTFWSDLLEKATEQLLEQDLALDYLIVDEIQDLTAPAQLDALDLMVKGGLTGGRCLFFGDFERQALYDRTDGRAALRERIPGMPTHRLGANCRNRPRIGAAIEVLAGMSPGYKSYRREDDGAAPLYYWYTNEEERTARTVEAIRDLKSDGFELNEIVLLSPRRRDSVAEVTRDPWLQQILRHEDGSKPHKGQLRYTTVHAFKGLEAPAVVLTDIDDPSIPGFEALLYVGLSRATDRLSVVGMRAALLPKLGVSG